MVYFVVYGIVPSPLGVFLPRFIFHVDECNWICDEISQDTKKRHKMLHVVNTERATVNSDCWAVIDQQKQMQHKVQTDMVVLITVTDAWCDELRCLRERKIDHNQEIHPIITAPVSSHCAVAEDTLDTRRIITLHLILFCDLQQVLFILFFSWHSASPASHFASYGAKRWGS